MKPSNPKDIVGSRKPPLSTIPPPVLFELGNAMLEGHLKYGGHNWRAMGIRSSVYYDACMRHLAAWWAGEDIDPDSGMSHIVKAIAGLVILRDAQINDKVNDDRPPKSPPDWMNEAKKRTLEVVDRYESVARQPFTESNREEWDQDEAEEISSEVESELPAYQEGCQLLDDSFGPQAMPSLGPCFEERFDNIHDENGGKPPEFFVPDRDEAAARRIEAGLRALARFQEQARKIHTGETPDAVDLDDDQS